jgi:hypothetical protein
MNIQLGRKETQFSTSICWLSIITLSREGERIIPMCKVKLARFSGIIFIIQTSLLFVVPRSRGTASK